VKKRSPQISFSDHTPTRVMASLLDDMAADGDRTIVERPWDQETKAGVYLRVEAPPSSVAPMAMPAASTGSFEASAGIERVAIALCATLLSTAALFGVIAAFVSSRIDPSPPANASSPVANSVPASPVAAPSSMVAATAAEREAAR
jgi:hypothetical protein